MHTYILTYTHGLSPLENSGMMDLDCSSVADNSSSSVVSPPYFHFLHVCLYVCIYVCMYAFTRKQASGFIGLGGNGIGRRNSMGSYSINTESGTVCMYAIPYVRTQIGTAYMCLYGLQIIV